MFPWCAHGVCGLWHGRSREEEDEGREGGLLQGGACVGEEEGEWKSDRGRFCHVRGVWGESEEGG